MTDHPEAAMNSASHFIQGGYAKSLLDLRKMQTALPGKS
jgi:hypothetical protein